MWMTYELEYCRQQVIAERALAETATDPAACNAHRRLADNYAMRAESLARRTELPLPQHSGTWPSKTQARRWRAASDIK